MGKLHQPSLKFHKMTLSLSILRNDTPPYDLSTWGLFKWVGIFSKNGIFHKGSNWESGHGFFCCIYKNLKGESTFFENFWGMSFHKTLRELVVIYPNKSN